MPHHVTQRGNRRHQTFFGEEDYQHYLELISRFCRAEHVAIWAYCLMPNHVHLIVVPRSSESLRRAIREAHRRYTRSINFREGWRGHLWQGRFASFVMDEDHSPPITSHEAVWPFQGQPCSVPGKPCIVADAREADRGEKSQRPSAASVADRTRDWMIVGRSSSTSTPPFQVRKTSRPIFPSGWSAVWKIGRNRGEFRCPRAILEPDDPSIAAGSFSGTITSGAKLTD